MSRGKEDALVTRNMVPGESVYGEKRISVEVCILIALSVTIYQINYQFENLKEKIHKIVWFYDHYGNILIKLQFS